MYFYFIISCLFILWHKINSTSKIETKKIDALLVLSNEIRNEILEIRNDITEIRNEIPEIHNNITEIRNDIPEIRNDITKMQNDITETRNDIPKICNDITEMRNNITEIRNSINKLRGTSKTENGKVEKAISDFKEKSKTDNEKVEKAISDLRISIIRTREISKNENKRTEKTISDLSNNINRIYDTFQTEKERIKRAISDLISNLSNGINEIHEAESKHNSQGLHLFSTTNNIGTRQCQDYSNKGILWKEFKSLADQKKKSEGHSNNSLFDEIASGISICKGTVYNYYHCKTNPRDRTVNEIRKWVIKEVENIEEVGKNSNLNNSLIFIVLGGF
ncbi:31941_t:CDS:2 [Gigaspora margarita]|uniref:31941_t:CDS:1 n=1 Tax=Gigaspora margarita TaxID=4874 RepID=A0ABN7U1K9_GIGMA|nr:31941_t:CDS:2 [Gigaspora margarita]